MLSQHSHTHFRKIVAESRKRVVELSQNGNINQQEIDEIVEFLVSVRDSIDEYAAILDRDTKILEDNDGLTAFEGVLFERTQSGFQVQKTNLYLWQIINFISINSPTTHPIISTIVSKLLQISIRYEFCQSPLAIKNALITIHNIVARQFKKDKNINTNSMVEQWMQSILVYHFQRKNRMNNCSKVAVQFKYVKSEQTLTQQTQWIAYIFSQIYSNANYAKFQLSFLQQIQKRSQNPSIGYYALHTIGNFLQDMIDKRVTTELVSGFECPIADVKEMYASKSKCLVQVKLTKFDLNWLCKRFNATISQYLTIANIYIKRKINSTKDGQSQFLGKLRRISDYLQECSHILNCILFIGGYNNKLQDFIIQKILQSDAQILHYFQVSYLLYRNIQSTKYQTKVALMVEMQREAKKKLFNFAEIQPQMDKIQVKDLKLQLLLANGQLVGLLRLLTNLVHINHRAQIPFENDARYLHMVLSLTHDSVSQATMKEWAIMFIRNVSEWSEKLREQIKAIKVQMRVEVE